MTRPVCRYEIPKPPARVPSATVAFTAGTALLAIALYVAIEFEHQVSKVNWSIVTGIMAFGTFMYVFYLWASDPTNTVRPWDMVLDPVTNRLSLWRTLITVTFIEATWVLAQWQIVGVPKDADKIIYLIGTVMVGLLAKVANGEWTDVKAGRDPTMAAPPMPDGVKP